MARPSGYEDTRASRHNNVLIPEWVEIGKKYGAKALPIKCDECRPSGVPCHHYPPDIVFFAPDLIYLDIKDPTRPNLAIDVAEFEWQEQHWRPLVYAWKEGDRWCYANHQMLRERMIGGVHKGSEKGSMKDYYLFKR